MEKLNKRTVSIAVNVPYLMQLIGDDADWIGRHRMYQNIRYMRKMRLYVTLNDLIEMEFHLKRIERHLQILRTYVGENGLDITRWAAHRRYKLITEDIDSFIEYYHKAIDEDLENLCDRLYD